MSKSPTGTIPLLARAMLVLCAGLVCAPLVAQPGGAIEHITVHAPSLAGNLQGNPTDRDVLVYLPPSYRADATRRYPVVYQLHGWLPGAEQWAQMIDLEGGTNRAIASGAAREMIVVLPDSLTVYGGSMYSSSVTSGDFERFVADDLVAAVDRRYRTLARRESRGLSGHSMGGYGTLRIGMRHPERYSSLYAMSSCCLAPYTADGRTMQEAARITTVEEGKRAAIGTRVLLTLAAAWSPHPGRPPLYFDFPVEADGFQPDILTKWNANVPLAVIDQHIPSLRSFSAIGIDIGVRDGLLGANEALAALLTRYAIRHEYETYDGDHTDRVAERYATRVLPFFSRVLHFE